MVLLKSVSVLMMLASLLIGFWMWQVDNIANANAEQLAREQAAASGSNTFSWGIQPTPVADRATGMAFAFLLCGVGCFTYYVTMQTKLVADKYEEDIPVDEEDIPVAVRH